MSSIHYFQRYSQPENVATNNTLLLLSRLYQDSPNKFKGFLNDLLEGTDIQAGIQFNQQVRIKNAVPDGSLSQESFKVIIETKLHKHFDLAQLQRHLQSFDKEQYQILLSLSPRQPDNSLKSQIIAALNTYNANNQTTIKYLPVTFKEVVEKFRNSIEEYDYELAEIVDDYEGYCIHDRLITDDESRMRVVTCGWSLRENFQYNIYYDPIDRGYSEHNYLGIYAQKAVKGIGKIANIVTADLQPSGRLDILDSLYPPTPAQEQNIKGVISAALSNNNWNIATGHKFFCVEQFYPTDFRKVTKYPLQGSKFFNLKGLLKVSTLPSTQDIAHQLKSLTW